MSSVVAWFMAILAWCAVASIWPSLKRRPGDRALRAFWASILLLALSLTVLTPEVYRWVDGVSGVPNVARLMGNGLVLAAGWQSQAFMFYLSNPPDRGRGSIRRSGYLLGVTVFLMGVFFALAPVHQEAADFVGRYAGAPFVLEYRLVFLAYIAWTLANIAHLSWGYAGLADRPSLQLGLRVNAVGAVFGLGYVANEALRVILPRVFGTDPIPDAPALTLGLEGIGVALVLVGSTMPAWGPRVGIPRLAAWIARYQTYRRLAPLWRVLYQASPEIALTLPPSPLLDALDPRDLDFRLHRRVVEIRDGCLALRSYVDPAVVEGTRRSAADAGFSDEDTEVLVAARCVIAAIEDKRRGRQLGAGSSTIIPFGGSTLAAEAAALVRVSQALTRPSLVPLAVRPGTTE